MNEYTVWFNDDRGCLIEVTIKADKAEVASQVLMFYKVSELVSSFGVGDWHHFVRSAVKVAE